MRLAIALLIFELLNGPFTPAGQSAGEVDSGTITGTVVRQGTTVPVPEAKIEIILLPEGGQAATGSRPATIRLSGVLVVQPEGSPAVTERTNTSGQFRFDNLVPGEYRITVYADGFVRKEYAQPHAGAPGTPVELVPGDERDLVFSLTPTATISGRVHDAAGEPLPAVVVQAWRSQYRTDGTRSLVQVQAAETNDLGEYRLFWMDPGEYLLSVAAEPVGVNTGTYPNVAPVNLSAATYYPGVLDEGEAVKIAVFAGEFRGGVNFATVPVDTFSLRGRVISSLPGVADAGVGLLPPDESGPVTALMVRTTGGGHFEFQDVAPGSYRLMGWIPDRIQSSVRTIPVEVLDRDVDDIILPIEPSFGLTARMSLDDNGEDAAQDWNEIRLRLVGVGETISTKGTRLEDPEEGVWFAPDLLGGTYRVEVRGANGADLNSSEYYVKRIRFEGEEILDDIIDVAGPDSVLDIVLGRNGGHLSGEALDRDGNPVRGAQLVLIPDLGRRNLTRLYKSAIADDAGRFRFEGITPGRYRLLGFEYLEPYAYFDPELVRRFEQRGELVRIDEGETLSANPEVISAAEIP